MKLLKTARRFWQEIVFIVSIGLLLLEIAGKAVRAQSMDGWDAFLVCWTLPLFVCLIGQYFWKKKALAILLSVPLGLSSVTAIFMALYGIFNSPSYRTESLLMLIIGFVLVIAAFKMSFKYDLKKADLLKI